jgi:hypothetical protein
VNPNQLVAHLSREDAIELIRAIDLRFAEIDFTLQLIKDRVKSLESDLTKEEIKKELAL